jgi:hypothetical protein
MTFFPDTFDDDFAADARPVVLDLAQAGCPCGWRGPLRRKTLRRQLANNDAALHRPVCRLNLEAV